MAGNPSPLNVVGVGASAGGVEALKSFAAALPKSLPCAGLVALHIPPGAPSVLARILDRAGPLAAETATPGTPIEHGKIYVAAPGHHLLADDGRMALSEGPTENGHRPAINALFRSIALAHGHRAIGVLLSGVLDDGVVGLAARRSRGGATIAQSPTDVMLPTMPNNTINAGMVEQQAPAARIGDLPGEGQTVVPARRPGPPRHLERPLRGTGPRGRTRHLSPRPAVGRRLRCAGGRP
nr:chemotaxis protein CheB [Mycobacterium sp. UM_Kg27]